MTTAPANTGPITLDDVRQALADTDPTATNAGALQKLIGRGSNATVQKHLDAIRAERAPAPVAPGQTPAAPADAIAAVWAAAWAQAQVHTLGRLEIVTAQREQLAGKVAQLGQDLAAAQAQVDESAAAGAALSAATDAALANADAAAADGAAELAAAKQALEATKIDFERLKAESQASLALAQKDAANAALTLQSTIDRLTDQVGELKSLLHHPKTKG